MRNYISILALVFISLVSCDKVDDPFEGIRLSAECDLEEFSGADIQTTSNDSTNTFRKLLFEEYTGHTCGNCPKFTKKLVDRAENELAEKAVMVSVHAGQFAALTEKYTRDFTTPDGNELLNRFKVNSFPGLIVNRANQPISGTLWEGFIDSLNGSGIYNDPVVRFAITSVYNPNLRKGEIKVSTKFLKEFADANFVVGVMVTEDKIVSKQTDYTQEPEDVDDYQHRHVFRGAVTSVYGASLATGSISNNANYTKSFCYDINENWAADNCHLVVFLGDANNNQIIQADEISIVEK